MCRTILKIKPFLNVTGNVLVLPNCTYALSGHRVVVSPTQSLNEENSDGEIVCHHREDILTLETNMVTLRFNFDQLSAMKITVKGKSNVIFLILRVFNAT